MSITLSELVASYDELKGIQEILIKSRNDKNPKLSLEGLRGSGESFVINSIVKQTDGFNLIVLPDKESAAYQFNDLQSLMGEKNVLFFPSSYRFPYQDNQTDNTNILLRAETLELLSKRKSKCIVVTYPEAIVEKVVTKKLLRKHTLEIKKGEEYSIDFILDLLIDLEFERVDFVYQPGQFSIRGGIVDVFSFANETPYRIEFFGDEVDSIRTFDPSSQLSLAPHAKVSILPNVQTSMLKEQRESFMEFLTPSTAIWIKDFELTKQKIELEFSKAEEAFNKLSTKEIHLPPTELYVHADNFIQQIEIHPVFDISGKNQIKTSNHFVFSQNHQPSFNKNFDLLSEDLHNYQKQGYQLVLVANSAKQIDRIHRIFDDIEKDLVYTTLLTNLHRGYVDNQLKVLVYTDHQIFDRYHRFRLKEGFAKTKQTLTIKELTNLQKGDFVTHIDHGVGRFDGLEKIDANGKQQEALRIIYKDGDLLYVSIHSLHRIAKFTGKEGTHPSVNKLGTKAWSNLKTKAKKQVKAIAYDLIKLYAQRKSQKGFQFNPDTYLQHELEGSFIYEDTPDQMTATSDVKFDMEKEIPMDRLVCGDVGFGKTEIAIRAAFKAATDGKQVAVLVPTTILALQHYKTFRDRLKEFPITVDYINRFKTAKQQTETKKKLESGEIDVLIGTHRIVGKDIKFKDLGLMIIDEEQKFGVGVKDKLKTIKANIDTLTLTATPIPRTLQFSLMKARDLSIINTPPPNRHPVQTEIKSFNEETIRDAVYYEISREGQVFFVHNRIQNIQEVANLIKKLCPEVRVKAAHGQMEGKQLEKIMMEFIEHEFDVLVSTTIIESGLDIPNANTIIINNAQNFGLSDLHQMRGRVGRSNRKAFCHLICPPLATLPPDSRRRLRALEEFSDLGSGFNIAMRDLDIRGAGNLLGGEQSGFMADIGLETYQKILNEALKELKENEFKDLFAGEEEEPTGFVNDCQVDTDLAIMLPDDYVDNIEERLSLYRTLSDIETEAKLLEFEKDLIDRFGELPKQALALLETMRLRWLGKELGFDKIVLKMGRMFCHFPAVANANFAESPVFMSILDYIKINPRLMEMKQKGELLRVVFREVSSVQKAIYHLSRIASSGLVKSE